MMALSKILTGAAGLAMVAGAAAPAAAQSYPYGGGYGGGYGGYGNQSSGSVVGSVIDTILGGGRYGAYGQGHDRVAVDQCARAAEQRVNRQYRGNSYGGYDRGYNDGYGNYGYGNNSYNMGGAARVVSITRVERRSNGRLRVHGLIDSGRSYNRGYGDQGYGNQGYGNQGYGYNSRSADLRFDCKIDRRGYISDVNINRNNNSYYHGY